jgi:hypothetical protein
VTRSLLLVVVVRHDAGNGSVGKRCSVRGRASHMYVSCMTWQVR